MARPPVPVVIVTPLPTSSSPAVSAPTAGALLTTDALRPALRVTADVALVLVVVMLLDTVRFPACVATEMVPVEVMPL